MNKYINKENKVVFEINGTINSDKYELVEPKKEENKKKSSKKEKTE